MRTLWLVIVLICAGSLAEARPWCSSARLNITERTICGDDYLRSLDARLQGVHDQAAALGQIQGASAWLRGQRDACGRAKGCIEAAYFDRISVLQDRVDAARVPTRPWCSAARLNLTERTVCGSATLTDLDAYLQGLYDQANPRGLAFGQGQWLRGQRDACGADSLCLAQAYIARITVLERRLGL